jgi:hypothetical protein
MPRLRMHITKTSFFTCNSSGYGIMLIDRTNSEQWIRRDVDRSGNILIWGTSLEFAWKVKENHTEHQIQMEIPEYKPEVLCTHILSYFLYFPICRVSHQSLSIIIF